MRRDPEEVQGATLPQVCNDPVPKRNQKMYHWFVRDVTSRGMLTATLSPLEHVRLIWTRDVRTSTFCLLLMYDCCLQNGPDESKSLCLKVWM